MLPLRHIGSLALVRTLVFVIAGGHIFGPVHSKPPFMKPVRVITSIIFQFENNYYYNFNFLPRKFEKYARQGVKVPCEIPIDDKITARIEWYREEEHFKDLCKYMIHLGVDKSKTLPIEEFTTEQDVRDRIKKSKVCVPYSVFYRFDSMLTMESSGILYT